MTESLEMREHVKACSEKVSRALNLSAMSELPMLGEASMDAWRTDRAVYLWGNGGSVGSAIHLANDFLLGASRRPAGAEGGKLLGAGGGGFLMFIAPPERHDSIRGALHPLREIPFRFAAAGSSIIFVH